MAICDRCSTSIHQGDGYLTYSDASVQVYETGTPSLGAGLEIGCLLLCEKCATGIYTDANFSKQVPRTIVIDPSRGGDLMTELGQAQRMAHDASLVTIAKRQGLSPQQALDQARRLGQEWWTDKEGAARKAMALAKAGPGKATAQRKWWQFWK